MKKSKGWVSVGDSNRDDMTLARAAEASGIIVDRFTRKVSVTSPAIACHLHCDADETDNAFQTYQHHLAVLKSTSFASGYSIAVRAGFARQLLIASDTPHMRELVTNGENGLLVNVGDSDHLANVIRAVMRGDVDIERLSGALQMVCSENHTYPVLRRHIEKMVAMCS
jgi:glycosyltransferase involved in cell wall biosynthesis